MASTVLPNGIIIPEKYSRDWYNDLYHNWQELDNLLGGGTPKDGTLTIQKNGTTVGTFSANQSTNETINITVPDVNDATLTIQKNGTDVATFSANASTNATANIEVPTKTSDLTNDSDFVQSSDLATVATSGSYNDLTNKPTIPTVNNATLTIQKNGANVQTFTANQSTNATANITVPTKTSDLTNDSGFITEDTTKIPLAGSNQISGDLIPSADGTVNLGSPSYQWNNAYIKSLTINGVVVGVGDLTLQSNSGSARIFLRNNDASNFPNSVNLYSKVNNVEYGVFLNGSTFFPTINGEMNFGYTLRRWKDCYTNAINGIEPSALSLPSDTFINIDTTGFTWGSNFTFTPSVNGHLFISIGSSDGTRRLSLKTGRGEYYFTNQTGILQFTMPVYKGKLVTILVASTIAETIVPSFTLFSLQGNV